METNPLHLVVLRTFYRRSAIVLRLGCQGAKLLIAQTSAFDHVLYGSANCTLAALGKQDFAGRNEEVCLYRRVPAGAARSRRPSRPEEAIDDSVPGHEGGAFVARDAQFARPDWIVVIESPAGNFQRAPVRLHSASDDLDERRFACAVFADQRVDFAGVQLERDVV